jgi:hypothetical protein
MYAAVDPVFVVMLTRVLGKSYTVWDKAATIRFKRPGRSTLYADFSLPHEEIKAIKHELATAKSVDRVYKVTLTDDAGVVHATVEKTIYIAKRESSATSEAAIAQRAS